MRLCTLITSISFVLIAILPGVAFADIDPANIVGSWLFDEGSGDTTADSSGNGNDGALVNGAGWEEGVFGSALSCDGADDSMQASSAALPTGGDDRSIAFWMKGVDTAPGNRMLVGYGNATDRQMSSVIQGLGGQPASTFGFWGWGADVPSVSTMMNDTWHHIAVSIAGTDVTVFLDGNVANTATIAALETPADTTLWVGNFSAIMGPYQGAFDEVAIFNTTLSEEDVQQLMNDGLASILAPIDPATIVGLWLFDEGSGDTTADSSGNGNDGALVNGAGWEEGVFGSALSCDGADDSMQASSAALPTGGDDRSIAFWMKGVDTAPGNRMLVGYGNATDRQMSSVIQGLGGQPASTFGFWGWGADVPSVSTMMNDTWHHIAVSIAGTDVTVFLDGNVANTATIAALETPADTTLWVGNFSAIMGPYQGAFDEVIVLNVALQQGQVQSLMKGIATAIPPAVDPDTLVGAWLFDEGSGDMAMDSSPSGNNGKLSGEPTWDTGPFGGAVTFDGADDSMQATTARLPVGGEARTITFWVKSPNTEVGNQMLVGYGNTAERQMSSVIQGLGGQPLGSFGFWGWGADLPSQALLENDTWYHIAATYSGDRMTLYVNGDLDTLVGGQALMTPADTTLFVANFSGIMGPFNGTFDDVGIFNVALDEEQIEFVMANGLASVLPQPALDTSTVVGAWLFDEGSGDIAEDASSGPNDGMLVNGPQRVPGVFGDALSTDGADDSMQVVEACGLPSAAEERTIMFWVQGPNMEVGNQMLVGYGETGDRQVSSVIQGLGGQPLGTFGFWGWAADVPSASLLANNTWYHIAATYREPTVTLYLDGELEASADVGALATPAGTDLWVGNFFGIMGPFQGLFDEVAVFNTALSQDDIRLAMGGLADHLTGTICPHSLTCELDLDEGLATFKWLGGQDLNSLKLTINDEDVMDLDVTTNIVDIDLSTLSPGTNTAAVSASPSCASLSCEFEVPGLEVSCRRTAEGNIAIDTVITPGTSGCENVDILIDGMSAGSADLIATPSFEIPLPTDCTFGPHTLELACTESANVASCSFACGNLDSSTLAGGWVFDEESGDTAADSSANGNDGALMNGASFVPGVFGNGMATDGVDDVMTASAAALPTLGQDRTLAGWVKGPNVQVNNSWYFGYGQEGANLVCSMITALGGRTGGEAAFWGWGADVPGSIVLDNDVWYHIATVYSGGEATTYVNGQVSAGPVPIVLNTPSDTEFWIGDSFLFMGPIEATFDEVVVFNTALSQDGIAVLMEGLTTVLAAPKTPGSQRAGDFGDLSGKNVQDGVQDATDQLNLLEYLFNGLGRAPCDGNINSEANRAVLDVNGDGQVDMSDAIYNLMDILLSGPDPVQGNECIEVLGCDDVCVGG